MRSNFSFSYLLNSGFVGTDIELLEMALSELGG